MRGDLIYNRTYGLSCIRFSLRVSSRVSPEGIVTPRSKKTRSLETLLKKMKKGKSIGEFIV